MRVLPQAGDSDLSNLRISPRNGASNRSGHGPVKADIRCSRRP
ncbi:hypothetical protein HMPREF0724_14007 [Prescottella equi ATCC 33707]|uniref:Uncharacterized protein n=1 Tax=Prescottella equi ATCC 33707 TaxID=525370 RepID=F1TJV4_RHOHA|nr:hypothetical protein HMPREF0724_14007 [Prescottella equi ATCC 33707]